MLSLSFSCSRSFLNSCAKKIHQWRNIQDADVLVNVEQVAAAINPQVPQVQFPIAPQVQALIAHQFQATVAIKLQQCSQILRIHISFIQVRA